MSEIDTSAFLKDLYDLRKIGAFKTGVSRPTFSPEDMESRRWLMDRMREVGLEPSIDGIGNVFGRHPGSGPHALVGSHIESQIEAGWLDGALGVVAGVALARAGLPVDVCAFADEESHFEGGYLGSRSIVGALTEEEIDRSRGRKSGQTLRKALEEAGLAGLPRMTLDADRYKGFFEMHIEQGIQLEKAKMQIGVVTGIVGIWQYRIEFVGQQDHAGGTTMEERRDAGLAAVRFLHRLDEEFPKVCSETSVWTTCNIRTEPGAPVGIIPGFAEVRLEFRDLSPEVLERMEHVLLTAAQEGRRRDRCDVTVTTMTRSSPVVCDPGMISALAGAAEAVSPGTWKYMPSGAGHDAKMIAKKLPVSMLFVPSMGGISHHWTEDTSDEDLANGIRVLGEGVRRFLGVP